MSISESDEVKSAYYTANPSGGSVEQSIDATENRDIIGVDWRPDLSVGNNALMTATVHFGATRLAEGVAAPSVKQGENWEVQFAAGSGGNGVYVNDAKLALQDVLPVIWEDQVTLNVFFNEQLGLFSPRQEVTVWYRER